MSSRSMSLKAKIRNMAKEKGVSAQVILQNYMFERFLERLSKSIYKDHFILKGGILIGALVGIANRSTMDMDITIKNYPLTSETLTKAIDYICSIELDDDVKFSSSKAELIRDTDVYGGYRITIKANYDNISTPLSVDITTGDIITPKEVVCSYKMLFNEKIIDIWAYNIETVLAEKLETILSRGGLNTRPRDFYDVYILVNKKDFKKPVFQKALTETMTHRNTIHILADIERRLDEIETDGTLKERWHKYTLNYPYAKDITYQDTINAIRTLSSLL